MSRREGVGSEAVLQKKKPLFRKNDAPPPTATTVMLESMLTENKKKKEKPRKRAKPSLKEETRSQVNHSSSLSVWKKTAVVAPRIWTSGGGLSSAPRVFAPKSAVGSRSVPGSHRRREDRRQRRDRNPGSEKENSDATTQYRSVTSQKLPVGDAAKTTRMTNDRVSSSLTLHIAGAKRKRPRDRAYAMPSVEPKDAASSLEESSSTTTLAAAPSFLHTGRPVIGTSGRSNEMVSTSSAASTDLTTGNENQVASQKFARKSEIFVPTEANSKDVATKIAAATKPSKSTSNKRPPNNDNFIRLNLRNSAGACRGARNKKSKRKRGSFRNKRTEEEEEGNGESSKKPAATTRRRRPTSTTGVDPLDDYADGVLLQSSKKPSNNTTNSTQQQQGAPSCARHQRPCKLLTVKKTGQNKGRKFYVCSLPRGEQCDFFAWADDTVEAAQRALMRNSSYSGFVARQVAAYGERFRSLTVPELRDETKRRHLNHNGKRQQLLTRLSLWVRDELAQVRGQAEKTEDPCMEDDSNAVDAELADEDQDTDDSDSDEESTSSEELELYQPEPLNGGSTFRDDTPQDDESLDDMCMDHPDNESASLSTVQRQLRDLFGHSSFREGQEWAIQRCLDSQRTMLVAPTGFGKSLCYALPASLMDGVCIVVSPLISLMQDQLRQLPPRIPATTLSGSMTAAAMVSTIDDVLRNRIKILFVSPERLASPSFRRLFRPRWNPETNTRERQFPPVSLLCVDEAHCMSQWGHNFRPSYLRLRSFVEEMQPRSVLAMTATAGPRVVQDVCRALRIPTVNAESCGPPNEDVKAEDNSGLRVLKCDRDNIDVSCMMVQSDQERIILLLKLLKVPPKKQSSKDSYDNSIPFGAEGCLCKGSIIVYVWRQRDAEVVAENLISSGVDGGVVVYHGGMDATARYKAQSKFMRGKARICVATVAFGLGIDKADVAAVAHLYLPASPEHYLQEIGRAGRDGRAAKAVALVLHDEVAVRHSLAHSVLLSKSQVKKLIEMVRDLVAEAVEERAQKQSYGDSPETISGTVPIALSVDLTVSNMDCKAETVETLLSIIEEVDLDNPPLRIEGSITDRATITLKRRSLERLAALEPVASCIKSCATCLDSPNNGEEGDEQQRTLQKEFLAYSFGTHQFSIAKCARLLGSDAGPRHVFAALRRLQNAGELELLLDSSGKALHLSMEPRGIALFCGPQASLDDLAERIEEQSAGNVRAAAQKALDAHNILQQVANVKKEDDNDCSKKSPSLCLFQELTSSYFSGVGIQKGDIDESALPTCVGEKCLADIRIDVSSLLRDLPLAEQFQVTSLPLVQSGACDYTALTLAKFLHALDTPRLPYSVFRRHALHGKWRSIRFESLLEAIHSIMEATTK